MVMLGTLGTLGTSLKNKWSKAARLKSRLYLTRDSTPELTSSVEVALGIIRPRLDSVAGSTTSMSRTKRKVV